MTPETDPADVIDLARSEAEDRVALRLEASSPFEHLTEKERMRLIVRVLCELVAYQGDELDESLSA